MNTKKKDPVSEVSRTTQLAGEYLELIRLMYGLAVGDSFPISFPTEKGTWTITLKRTK